MDTKDLSSFLKVYELKSISSAAQHLFITPQGLSKTIIKLEKELDVKLFMRTTYGVEPTPYADELAIISYKLIEKLDSIKKSVLEKQKKVRLNIASTYGVMSYLSVEFIQEFENVYPDIQLNILEYPDKPIEKLLDNETVDIAFLTGPIDTTRFEATFFTSHKHCLLIHKSHPIAEKRNIEYTDLNEEPLALMGKEFKDYHNNKNRFLRAGSNPVIIMETSEIYHVHRLASQNKALGLSVDFLAFDTPPKNTVIRPFSDPQCSWDTYLTFKKNKEPSKEALIFHEFALDWIKQNKNVLFQWMNNKEHNNS